MKQKVSRIDYSKAMLPRTRRAQFLDCYKMNFALLVKCGLILFLFALPLIGFSLFMDFYYVSIMSQSTEAIKETQLVFFLLYNIGVLVFCFLIVIALSGVLHILRNFIWQEGIFFRQDFSSGIKQNVGKNLLFFLICCIFYIISYFIYALFAVPLVSYAPIVIFIFIIFPIFIWIMLLNNTYISNFKTLLRNGTFFYIKSLGPSILGSIMMLSLFPVIFIPFSLIWLKYIFITLYFIFVFPTIILIMVLYTTNKFDEFINKETYPDYYLKGLNHD